MDTPDDFTGPVNIGNPGEFTILELAKEVINITNSRSKLTYKPLPEDDPLQRQPDITIAKNKFGWEPTTALRDGLKKTITYFEGVLHKEDGVV